MKVIVFGYEGKVGSVIAAGLGAAGHEFRRVIQERPRLALLAILDGRAAQWIRSTGPAHVGKHDVAFLAIHRALTRIELEKIRGREPGTTFEVILGTPGVSRTGRRQNQDMEFDPAAARIRIVLRNPHDPTSRPGRIGGRRTFPRFECGFRREYGCSQNERQYVQP